MNHQSDSADLPVHSANCQPADLARLLPHTTSIADAHDEMVQLVIELCNVNSGTMNLEGVRRVSELLVREFSSLGGELEIREVDPLDTVDEHGRRVEQPLGPLIHIRKRPDVRPRILLCIHMDTVYPENHAFQSCQWLGDDHLNGPGVADAKGGLVVMLYALKAFERSPLAQQLGWEVIINPDEELGSPGSEAFLKQRASEADIGLLFEPSLPDGAMVSWRKGVGNFSFVVRGKSVHAGREFENGRNAVVACCRLMDDIHRLNTDPEVTFNVGRINGGDALNVVPDCAVGRINVRVKTKEQMQNVEQQMMALTEKYRQLDGIDVELVGGFTSPPKEVTGPLQALQQRIEQCGQSLDLNVHWRGTGGASDGNKFAAAGLANIDTLGPLGSEIHSENEFLVPSSLVSRAQLTSLVMLSYCRLDSGQV